MYLQPYFWALLYSINLPACLATLSWFLDHCCTLHFHLNLRINLSFSFPTLIPYGISYWDWLYRPIEDELLFKTCWVFWSMNTVYLPICLGFFHFNLVIFYTFQCISLKIFLSDLFLDIYYIYILFIFSLILRISYIVLLYTYTLLYINIYICRPYRQNPQGFIRKTLTGCTPK